MSTLVLHMPPNDLLVPLSDEHPSMTQLLHLIPFAITLGDFDSMELSLLTPSTTCPYFIEKLIGLLLSECVIALCRNDDVDAHES